MWCLNADTKGAIIMCLYQICLLKVSLVGSFKHLPDSRSTQITSYICMQLASKSSSWISCIIHSYSLPISLAFRVSKMCKIQRENILKRPIWLYRLGRAACHRYEVLYKLTISVPGVIPIHVSMEVSAHKILLRLSVRATIQAIRELHAINVSLFNS